MNKKIIIKIGTESLADFNTSEKVRKMVSDIARLIQEKIHVVLISSGAVWCGREIIAHETNKQVLAAVGQPILMARYAEKFLKHNITTAQILPTHALLEDGEHQKTFLQTLHSILQAWILPILNENDPLSTVEMRALGKWADNDQNALLVASLLNANNIVLITNTNGVYSDKDNVSTRIKRLSSDIITESWMKTICGEKSSVWTGGMQSKLLVGKRFAENWWVTHICDGLTSWIWEHIMEQEAKWWTIIQP